MRNQSDSTIRLGGWLFKRRTSLPVPVGLALLIIPASETRLSWLLVAAGVALTAAGEGLRLWGVHHIGAVSRTRSERLGPLIDSGPFALVRNPLYIGNVLLWVGFALVARLVWLAPAIVLLLGLEYHAIVRWEERLLEERIGDAYRDYTQRVGRWMPTRRGQGRRKPAPTMPPISTTRSEPGRLQPPPTASAATFSWGDTLFSERGTLVAVAAGYFLLWLKARS